MKKLIDTIVLVFEEIKKDVGVYMAIQKFQRNSRISRRQEKQVVGNA